MVRKSCGMKPAGAALLAMVAAGMAAPAGAGVPGDDRQCQATPITMGYYRMWRDVATTKAADRAPDVQSLDQLPPAINLVSVFATKPKDDPDFWQALKSKYLPKLHAQGTKVVFTLFIDDLADADVPLTADGYAQYAHQLVDTYIGSWGLDGLDIDTEQYVTGDRLTRAAGIMAALGQRIGPKSNSGKLLIYDTNLSGTQPIVSKVAPYVSYVLVQSYGRPVSSLQRTWDTFAPFIHPCQYLIGFSFYEERGANWGDTTLPFEQSHAAAFAQWQPQGAKKGGIFAYAVDRDGKQVGDDTISRSTYSWMKQLALIQRAP